MAAPDPEQLDLQIRGMHCAACVGVVEQALRAVPGVTAAAVNLATERASVQLAEPTPKDPERLIAAVRAAGYDARLPTADATASEGLPDTERSRRLAELSGEARRVLAAAMLALPIVAAHIWHAWFELGHAGHGAANAGAGDALGAIFGFFASPTGLLVQAALTVAVLWIAAGAMLAGAWRGLRAGHANMDLLVSLGALTALGSSVAGVAIGRAALVHFDAAAMIAVLVALGKHLESRARGRAGTALALLTARVPRTALRVVDGPRDSEALSGAAESISIGGVAIGMRLRLTPNQPVPVDGTILAGHVTIDASSLTGESLPVERGPGGEVRSGTRVVAGLADMRATATGADSAAARIARLVERAQSIKTPWQRLADRVAGFFVPIVLGLALATLAGWWLFAGDPAVAIERAIAVLVVACPCAMGLAIPTAVLVATTAAAERGILVRNAAALEAAATVVEVLLDKTGTLTRGAPTLATLEPLGGGGQLELLRCAASAAQFGDHPLSHAIADAATQAGQKLSTPTNYDIRPGFGLLAEIDGARVLLGSAAWLADNGMDTVALESRADALAAGGLTVVWCARGSAIMGLLGLRDEPHPEAADAVRRMQALGVRTRILSGDRKPAVAAIAAALGVTAFEAQLSPEEKLERVQAAGRRGPVAMVGDGINDAPALAVADVGIAIGTGADVARETAEICLVGHSPRLIADAITLARAAVRTMRQNLAWAFGYNALMLPLAMLTPLPPAAAAAAMMLSSVSVIGNSLRLRRRVRPSVSALIPPR